MNGAQSLIRTLVDSGVTACFANPGTSEMHFVKALDDVPEMRGVLALFEGVATGAADGYGRMADHPAATLLHLGSGLSNGGANLHNARRAHTPMVNIVGDHATYHKRFDAPLDSDIEASAGTTSGWMRTSKSPDALAADAAEAVAAALAPPGQIATLILPADVSWGDATAAADPIPRPTRATVPDTQVAAAAAALRSGEPAALLVGGSVCRERGLVAASRVAQATGAKLLGETFPARLERGAGRPDLERLAYLAEFIEMQLAGVKHLVLADTRAPVSFFAYPGKASDLVPEGCEIHTLAAEGSDAVHALEALADFVGAPADGALLTDASRPEIPTGDLDAGKVAAVVGALLPEGAIVVDEAQTAGIYTPGATAGAPQHDWLTLCGGAIGMGIPLATGAAVACPDRRVLNLEADGSAMYTLQGLWTQAREGLDVTTIIYNNGSYAILNMEMGRVGAEAPGPTATSLLDITRPDLSFVSLAEGLGVPAVRVDNAGALHTELAKSLHEEGPKLIEAMVPSGF
jgi:acetolactate synthase I/II/III large subunit